MGAPFPPDFFDRADPTPDREFFARAHDLQHMDETAERAIGDLYEDLGIDARVLDLFAGWTSHFNVEPDELVGLGPNPGLLDANGALSERVAQDLDENTALPFADERFDDVVCSSGVDYLTRPLEVFAEVARVLRPGGRFVCTFTSRCFPERAIHGWLNTDDGGHVRIVRRYFELTPGFGRAESDLRTSLAGTGDLLWAVWAARTPAAGARPETT
jgi:SAM-dependent methyltransferase